MKTTSDAEPFMDVLVRTLAENDRLRDENAHLKYLLSRHAELTEEFRFAGEEVSSHEGPDDDLRGPDCVGHRTDR